MEPGLENEHEVYAKQKRNLQPTAGKATLFPSFPASSSPLKHVSLAT